MLFSENRGFFVDIHGNGGIVVSKDPRFSAAFQPDLIYGSSLYLDIFSLPIYSVLSFNGGYAYKSFPSNGIIYRGFAQASVSTGMGWRITNYLETKLEFGGSFANYFYSPLYFVFPFILAEPIVEIKNAGISYLTVTISTPVRLDLRKDLDFSIEGLFSIGLRFYPFLIDKNIEPDRER